MNNVAIELRGITKRFGSVVANSNVNLTVCNGEILALLGENGSGKTTLMNMISGIYHPDEGHIIIGGEAVSINSPHDAFNYKIGMIHQHFKLVDLFTAAENIVLGLDENGKFDIKTVSKKVSEISEKYGFDIDPDKKIYEMSVSEKQTVEIIKVLYRGADILILDEPTAVLTPQETRKLFDVLRRMRGRHLGADPRLAHRHHGIEERRRVDAVPVEVLAHLHGDHGVSEHDGDDRMMAWDEIEAELGHSLAEALRVGV